MMAALDGEISEQERRELDRRLAADAALREEWERMRRVKEVTSEMGFREPPEEIWGRYWSSVYNRAERGVGWVLASVGVIVIAGYLAWELVGKLVADSSIPLPVKLAIFAVALGSIILVVSVGREKYFAWRRDPYKEIER
jgi:ferric-dicitrate binding protein FerR (iron transport regulator)